MHGMHTSWLFCVNSIAPYFFGHFLIRFPFSPHSILTNYFWATFAFRYASRDLECGQEKKPKTQNSQEVIKGQEIPERNPVSLTKTRGLFLIRFPFALLEWAITRIFPKALTSH